MAKDKITEYDSTAANNTVVGDVNLAENSALPSDMNNAVREIMSHQKEAFGSGTPLYVDQTNNRVGVGNASPATALHVSGGAMLDGITVIGREQTTYDSAGAEVLIDASASTPPLICHVGGSEKIRFQAAGGISFNGDTAAANALDDYEEGTWTPTDASGQGLSLTVYSSKYTKIGNSVYVTIYVGYPTNTNTANAFIGGLPFASENTSNLYHILCAGYKTTSSLVAGLIFPNQSYFDFRNELGSNLTNANLSGVDVILSGVYQAA